MNWFSCARVRRKYILTKQVSGDPHASENRAPCSPIQLVFFIRECLLIAIVYRHKLLSVAANLHPVAFRVAALQAQESGRRGGGPVPPDKRAWVDTRDVALGYSGVSPCRDNTPGRLIVVWGWRGGWNRVCFPPVAVSDREIHQSRPHTNVADLHHAHS